MARIFLSLIGILYAALGVWCAVAPELTSSAVGFAIQPGQGQSEFFTVYGGLEVGLGMLFLWPLVQKSQLRSSLFACLTIHACLVLFRSASFVLYSGFETTTYVLAAIEWFIFLTAAVFYARMSSKLGDSAID